MSFMTSRPGNGAGLILTWMAKCTQLTPLPIKGLISYFFSNEWLTDGEKDEELLVAFSDTVVYPRTVMIHLSNASTTNAAQVQKTQRKIQQCVHCSLNQSDLW